MYAYGWKLLSLLAENVNLQLSQEYIHFYEHFRKGVLSLWDSSQNRFLSKFRSGGTDHPAKANTVQGLFPLLLDLPAEMREALLGLLKSPDHYNLSVPFPSVSKSDPSFNPTFTIDLMWRGPTWAAPNYFILHALFYSGETALFQEFAGRYVRAVQAKGLWEMYDPETGAGMGVANLSMTASVVEV